MHPDSSIGDVSPYLCVRDAAAAIDFYTRVFGAEELMRLAESGGRIAHAELRLGPVVFMLADERPEQEWRSPLALGGTGVLFHLHVGDVDGLTSRAVAAGATLLRPPADEAHGERQAKVRDPSGTNGCWGRRSRPCPPRRSAAASRRRTQSRIGGGEGRR